MARKVKGIRRKGGKWNVYVRVNGRQYQTTYALDTALQVMKDWQDEQRDKHGARGTLAGSFADDVQKYLALIAGLSILSTRTAHLALWVQALGGDRTRRSITTHEITAVLQQWIQTHAPGTVRLRRGALRAFFNRMDGDDTKFRNPVVKAFQPKEPKLAARGRDYPTLERCLAAMADYRPMTGKPDQVSYAKIRARCVAYSGLPPALVMQVRPHHLDFVAGTVRVQPRHKGEGVEARTLRLSDDAIAAFKDLVAANACGPFNVGGVNQCFQRGAAKAGVPRGTIRLYDLRHSFLTEVYRRTHDLATVARLGMHAPGSPLTARYALGANDEVDAAAVAAFNAGLETQRQHSLKAAPVQEAADKVSKKGVRARKSSKRIRLAGVA